MIPTGRLVALLVVPLLISAVAFFVRVALAPLIAIDLVIVLVCLVDAALNRGHIEATRSFAAVQAVGRPFEVTLHLRALGKRTLRARLVDDAPGRTTGLPASVTLSLRPCTVVYTLRVPSRGQHSFGPITIRFRSILGLFEGQRRIHAQDTVRVYPNFAQLRQTSLQALEDERRAPVRARRKPGGDNEFERLRPYVTGDVYRHIDWRATARRQELVSREFGQESNQNVILMLDAGRMMGATFGELSAFDHALNAALMVGQTALRHGDRVGVLAFDQQVRAWLPPRSGSRSGARLIRGLYDVFPSDEEPNYAEAFRYLSARVKRRSLVVLFTSVIDQASADLSKQLVTALAGRHIALCVWVRDPEVEALLHKPDVDPFVRGAAAELASWRERSLADLQRRGALVVSGEPEALTSTVLARYLEIKARRLL